MLYNALLDTNYTQDEVEIEDVRLEDVLYKNFQNDLALGINKKYLVFGEHQSTINLNKQHSILEKCPIIKEYMQFVESVRRAKEEGEEEPVTCAVRSCIEQGILAEYLLERGSEVENMLVAEYNYEEDIEVQREEAYEEGFEVGVQSGIQQSIMDILTEYGSIPKEIEQRILQEQDETKLKQWLRLAAESDSVVEFVKQMQ